ncbi:MAG: transketolase, partial [Bacteroidota bacterium]|nr:transketolase [Bacteroidota bacterium]MDX5430111.1 transketolase [Bacteroidota bacterium]MDX5468872.1 transketolase [Bacteroidota bacterium]
AKAFQHGDFRSGYYRDQTFMFATGMSNIKEFFAQLYAHPSVEAEPCSAGRSMNGHFGTRLLDDNGNWLPQTDRYNSSADISPTAGQMPRLLGLALASKLYRENKDLHGFTDFSINGNEVAFGTIGNASTSEGGFWETINAAGVLQVPMVMSVWDDGYGISVPARYQTTKENISEILSGFQSNEAGQGYEIFKVKGWDYANLVKTYQQAAAISREKHTPVLIHVTEVTQPQGHSTSGSHERYKTPERLEWELEYDCIAQMRQWMEANALATAEELDALEKEWKKEVNTLKKEAFESFLNGIKADLAEVATLLDNLASETGIAPVAEVANSLRSITEPLRKDLGVAIDKALRATLHANCSAREALVSYRKNFYEENYERYSSKLHSESSSNALNVPVIPAAFSENSPTVDGREVVQACFDKALERDPRVFAFGEDVGKIGDVNQGFAGLQEKYGELRVTDKGIRELTIVGEGIGTALRGLRPIAEIQYLDYLLYAIQIMSDDIATLQYRTKGGQKAPVIIRTRGHRLEGIWHSGSPMGMIIHAIRGMHVLVPRNMTQAAGFYNTLLQSDEPALVVECLNGYRLKEVMPDNIGEFTVPLGVPEVLKQGSDVTLVTYGSCVRVAEEAIAQLEEVGINVELIDVQSLLPFDINHSIVESLKKTNRIVFLDEDVPGGATSFMMQQVLETQKGYFHLDSEPRTITAKAHRPAYGSDGDFFSKPSAEEVFAEVYALMRESDPNRFPAFV